MRNGFWCALYQLKQKLFVCAITACGLFILYSGLALNSILFIFCFNDEVVAGTLLVRWAFMCLLMLSFICCCCCCCWGKVNCFLLLFIFLFHLVIGHICVTVCCRHHKFTCAVFVRALQTSINRQQHWNQKQRRNRQNNKNWKYKSMPQWSGTLWRGRERQRYKANERNLKTFMISFVDFSTTGTFIFITIIIISTTILIVAVVICFSLSLVRNAISWFLFYVLFVAVPKSNDAIVIVFNRKCIRNWIIFISAKC